jgi:hypothetical protein
MDKEHPAMKPLKAALAAALLLAALCSSLSVSAGAAYPDAEEIAHTEAADALTALGSSPGTRTAASARRP